jgi:hypothetical protein
MSSLTQFAKSELRTVGAFDDDCDVGVQVDALMATFVAYREGSGKDTDVNVVIDAFTRLANHLPISPLTGEDDEWEVPAGMSGQIEQNKRCPRVVRDSDMAWDTKLGRVAIMFPYTPC